MPISTWKLGQHVQEVVVQAGVLDALGGLAPFSRPGRSALVVTDSNLAPLYLNRVVEVLRQAGISAEVAIVPAGEESKTIRQAEALFDRLGSMNLGRDGVIVALGGGMITDLAGFVAGTWLRGVALVNCPTSLEAAIDAAIGGKTGVNHAAGKNLIGVFHPASHVVIDPHCLRTLPVRDLIAGLAESLKHGFIADPEFLDWQEGNHKAILARDPAALEELIARNVAVKLDIAGRDFRESSGERMRLNFGHTVGHAIEAASGYALRHGECVALGMLAAARISQALGLLDEDGGARVARGIATFGLPVRWDGLTTPAHLRQFMDRDKKASAAGLRWVLLAGIGRTLIRDDVPPDCVDSAIASLG